MTAEVTREAVDAMDAAEAEARATRRAAEVLAETAPETPGGSAARQCSAARQYCQAALSGRARSSPVLRDPTLLINDCSLLEIVID